MSAIQFAIVGLRLLAVYSFVLSVPLFSSFAFVASSSGAEAFGLSRPKAIIASLLPGGSLLLLAILLFVYSRRFASRLVPPDSSEPRKTTCTFEEVQAIAFAVAGILILVEAFPRIGPALLALVEVHSLSNQGGMVSPHQVYFNWLSCAGVAGQVVVGLLLLLNPEGLRNVWRRLRTAAT